MLIMLFNKVNLESYLGGIQNETHDKSNDYGFSAADNCGDRAGG